MRQIRSTARPLNAPPLNPRDGQAKNLQRLDEAQDDQKLTGAERTWNN